MANGDAIPQPAPGVADPIPTSAGPGAFANFPSVAQINQATQPPPTIKIDQNADPATRIRQATVQGGTPVFAPDGTAGYVHRSYLQQFLNDNPDYKRGVFMTAPDGTPGRVPIDQAGDFQNHGYKAGLPVPKDISQVTDPTDPRYGSDEWYASKMPQPVVDGLNWLNEHFFKPKAEVVGRIQGIAGDVAERTLATALTDPLGSAPLTMQQLQAARQQYPRALGIARGVGSFAGGFSDPTMWPLLFAGGALPAVQKLAGLGFSGQMLYGAYHSYPEFKAALDSGNTERAYELLTDMGLSTAMGLKGLHGEITPAAKEVARTAAHTMGFGYTPAELLIKAGGPSVQGQEGATLPQAIETAAPRLVEQNKIRKIQTVGDVADAAYMGSRRVWEDGYQPQIDRHPDETFDATPIGDGIRSGVDEGMRDLFPEQAKKADSFADKFQGDLTLDKASSYLRALNAQLKSYYKMGPEGRAAAGVTDGLISAYESAAEGLRNHLDTSLENLGEQDPGGLRQEYGALKQIQRVFEKRAVVTGRQKLLDWGQVISGMAGLGEAGGLALAGHPLGALTGLVPFAGATAARYYNSPDVMVRRAIAGFGREAPAARPLGGAASFAGVPRAAAASAGDGAAAAPSPAPSMAPVSGGAPEAPAALPPGQYEMPPSSTERPPGPQPALPPAQGIQAPASFLPPQGALPPAPARPQLPGEVGTPPLAPQLGTGARETPRGLLGPARLPASISGERAAREAAAARGTNLPAWANLGQVGEEPLAARPLSAGRGGAQATLGHLRSMNTIIDEGGADRAATIHLDDNAHNALLDMGLGGGGRWHGINLQVDGAQRIANAMRGRANAAEQAQEPDIARNYRTLADQIDRVANLNYDPSAGHAGVPLIHDPGSFAHEAETHGGQRAFAGGEGDIRNFTDAAKVMSHPAAVKGSQVLLNSGYANHPGVLAAEMEAHILDGNFGDLGLTREEAVDFMKHSQRVLAEHHGPDVMLDPPRLAQRYLQSIDRFIGGAGGETGATAETQTAQPPGTAGGYGENVRAGEAAPGAGGGGNRAPSPAGTTEEVAPGEALASRALSDEEAEDWRISTRRPTPSTKDPNRENPMTEDLQINRQAIRDSPPGKGGEPLETKLANRVSDYVGQDLSGTPQQRLDAFHKQIVDNLVWLHNQLKPEFRDRAKLWYDSANKLAADWAEKYNLTHQQVAAVIASLSPQKDWNMNVSLAQRMIEGWQQHQNTPYSDAMEKKSKELASTASLRPYLNAIRGKTLSELTDPEERAMWIRLRDEAHDPQSYEIYAPEGGTTGVARNIPTNKQKRLGEPGTPSKLIWHSNPNLAKALSIIEDGSRQNISDQLGNKHKVRNFYNNIIAPNSNAGDVTIDTHAVAAAHLRPLAGPDPEVTHNFGSGIPAGENPRYPEGVPGPGGSAVTGVDGSYGLYADAYRAAAKKLGLSPRQLQSITWEGIRSLFPAEYKQVEANKDIIDGIWSDYTNGKIPTIGQTRKAVVKAAGGFKPAEWENPVGGVNEGIPAAGINEATRAATGPQNISGGGVYGRSPEGVRSGGGNGPATRVSPPSPRRVASTPSPVPALFKRVSRR